MRIKLFITVFVATLTLSGCGWLYQSHGDETPNSDISASELQVPEFEFVNQFDESFGSKDLEGQMWITSMIFTRCPTVCNMMTPNMGILQEALKEEGLDVKLVSFTVDPEFDNPERLRTYGENNAADFDRWIFLTGYTQEEFIDFSADAFATLVMEIPDSDDIVHGTSFFLVDGKGNVIRRYDGLKSDPTPIINDLKKIN
ncbi:SCO family protein [Bacillus sp. FJAT-45350]|uniref:SCO family protein n=1 Tax=Bacillus sp. FJAT-45350 TaxID=2011014 RepID=UPI000BB68873|nr:SCO family protein [Bacillus sp. FJAT-45350]